ncbi:MAG: hypothetical protein ABRQ26_05910 [Syntrophomonadaceae bacterium]
MKEYIKPSINIKEIRSDEIWAIGRGKVYPLSSEEPRILRSFELDTSIIVKE